MDQMDNINREDKDKDFSGRRFYGNGTAGAAANKMPLWYHKSRNIVYYILGIIEVLLAFRLVFKLLGASRQSGFIAFLYSITGIFAAPFSGIFNSFTTNGLSAQSVFEPAVIIAAIVYATIAWGVINLLRLKASREGY